MLQVKISEIGKVIYENIPNPVAKAEEAVVKVKSVGICGSDIHVFKGVNPVLKPPVVQGHEFGGVIKSINDPKKSYSFKVGDKVSVFPIVNCMNCYYCNSNKAHLCENQKIFDGMIFDGAMKEEIAVPLFNLIKLPEKFDIVYASLVEPVSVAMHASKNIKNSNVLVVGSGTIGLFVQQILNLFNNRVIAMDINKDAIELSKKLGSDLALDANDNNNVERISNFLKNEKVDVVIDCVGNKDSFEFARNVLKKTGEIILIGVPKGFVDINLVYILIHELTIKGSYLYTKEEFIKSKNLMIEDKINYKKIVSKIFPLNQAVEAYDYKLKHPSEKVVMTT